MATLTWKGGTGDWYNQSQWTSTGGQPTYPQPGDAASVGSGEVDLVGSEAKDNGTFDADAVTLGTAGGPATVLRAEDAILNHNFTIALAGSAEVLAEGRSVLQGRVTDDVAGSTLTLGSTPDASGASMLDLQNGFSLSLGANTSLDLEGNVAVEATAGFVTPSTTSVINNATVTQIGVRDTINGALTGTGTWNLKFGTTLALGGSVGSGQTIAFGGIDGRLLLAEVADANGNITGFAGKVTGFAPGNLIDFSKVGYASGDEASYNADTHTLTLTDASGKALATLNNVSAQAGTLQAVSDGSGGTLVEYAGTGTRESYEIAGADKAMGSDTVRRTLTVPGTATPITGAGVKVGIISDSFNIDGQANADAAAGYLPANPDSTSAVKILQDGKSGDEDEGRAMAELVHQVAPGAAIDFCTVGNPDRSQSSMASAIQQLQTDGCKVIVDDWTFFGAPMYQVGGSLDAGVNAALAAGVDYFTSAGNYGDSFLQQTFKPQAETLYDGTPASAHIFSNGTPYENITVSANSNAAIDLQWTAPYEGPNNTGAPDALTFKVFNSAHNLVATSSQATENGLSTTDISADLSNNTSTAQTYSVAVYLNGAQVQPNAFSMVVSGYGGGTGPGGVIDDPEAASGPNGDVRGQQLVPGVNSVGAVFYGDSPAFGEAPTAAEYFSDSGPGQVLYDANGNALPAPVSAGKVNFAAPDGVNTAVPGFAGFYGTSAAAPDAAAVAALMLQADPSLTQAQVSTLLARSALPFGQPQWAGAGLIQAKGAVQGAIVAATTPIWTAQGGTTNWSLARNWSDDEVPGAADTAVLTDGDGQLSGAYAVTYDVASSTIGGLTVDGGSTTRPSLTIASGDDLTVSGTATLANDAALIVQGSFEAAQLSVDAASSLDFDAAGSLAFAGAISGAGGLVQGGPGTLTLSGADSYAGATAVTGGALLVDGSTGAASAVAVATGAVLGGAGTVGGSVDLSGTLSASAAGYGTSGTNGSAGTGPSYGTLTTGALTMEQTAVLDEEIGGGPSGMSYDRITVNGTATLGGTLNLSLAAPSASANGDVFTVLTATGFGTSRFANTTATSAGRTFSIGYTSTSVTLTDVTPTPPAPTITTPANGADTNSRTIAGTGESGDTIDLTINGQAVTPAQPIVVGANGLWSYAPAQPLADGAYTVSATQTNAGGNTSGAASDSFTLDTTAPTITALADSGAGIDANGNGDLGAGKTVTLTVTTSEAVTVQGGTPTLTLNDGATATYTGGSGTAQQTFSYTVAAGQNTVKLAVTAVNANGATVTDAAGNPLNPNIMGAAVPSGTLVIDTTAPVASSVTDTVAQNSGPTPIGIAAPSDNLTAAGSLAITAGSLPTDGTVTLANGQAVATGEALTSAQFTGLLFTPTQGLSNQGSTFTYTVTDGAGNATTGTAALNIGSPGAPTITGVHATTDQAEAPVAPFAGVMVADPSSAAGATETLTIVLTGGGGTLTGAGLTRATDGSYQLAGTAAQVTQQLDALSFTPTSGGPGAATTTTFVLTDRSSAGTSVVDSGTSVADTAASAPPPPPGQPTPDTVLLSPLISYRDGTFTLTGTASSPAGVRSVEITAQVDGVATDLGPATVNANGTFTFSDAIGAHTQGFITATETDGAGSTAATQASYSLTGGLSGGRARQDRYTADGSAEAARDVFKAGGTQNATVLQPGQTFASSFFDTFHNGGTPDTTFVFDPGFGRDVVDLFRVDGADHDTLTFKGSDYGGDIATVLANARDTKAGLLITDPVASSPGGGPGTHDTLLLKGVTKQQLAQNQGDIAFHA